MRKKITLHIDSGSLRLMMARKKRIIEWAMLPLEKDLISNNTVTDPAALASRLKQILKIQDNKGKEAAVILSGIQCIFRPLRFPHLPEDLLDEAVKREAHRVLPVDPDELYLYWQQLPGSSDQSNVLLVAIPRTTIDSYMAALQQAGISVSFLGIKPLLLAEIVSKRTAIIVDVQQHEADIIIKDEGFPRTVRTIAFPDEEFAPGEKTELVIDELARTINFYNTNNPDNILSENIPVIANGEAIKGMTENDVFMRTNLRPLEPLDLSVDNPLGFNADQYLPNICYSIHLTEKRKQNGREFVVRDSLPDSYLVKKVSLVNIVAVPAAVVAAVILVFLTVLTRDLSGELNSLRNQTEAINLLSQERMASRQEMQDEITRLSTDLSENELSTLRFQTALQTIETTSSRINEEVTRILDSLPSSMSITDINHTGKGIVVKGTSMSEDDILVYLKALEKSLLFENIVITNLNKSDGQGMEYQLNITPGSVLPDITGIKIILRFVPGDVVLTNLGQHGDLITVMANSGEDDSIVMYLEKLEESGVFTDIALQSRSVAGDGTIDFTFTMRVKG